MKFELDKAYNMGEILETVILDDDLSLDSSYAPQLKIRSANLQDDVIYTFFVEKKEEQMIATCIFSVFVAPVDLPDNMDEASLETVF